MNLKLLFQRRYYRYLFYKLKRLQLREYIFIDLPTTLICLLFFIVNIILFFPTKPIIHFPKLEIEFYVIETLLRTISIFIGIVFSFILLSFNVFNRYFGRFAFLNFFKSRSIKILFTLFIISIVFMLYSLGYLKEIQESNRYANSLFVMSIFFSTITIFSIFPVIITLLRESQNRDNILKIINQLNEDWVLSYHENVLWNKTNSHKHYQKDPITLLTEIGTVAVKEFDQTTLTTIVHGCKEHFEKAIKLEKNKEVIEPKELYYEFRTLLNNLFQIATKERNENALFILLRARFRFEEMVIKNQKRVEITDHNNKYYGWIFNMDFQDFFNRAIQFNEDEVCRRIIDDYRNFITTIIQDVLPEREFDYDFGNRMKNMEETGMVSGAFREVDTFLSLIIATKKYHLFKNISNLFSTLDLNTISSKNTPNTKIFLLHIINNCKLDNFELYIRNTDINDLPYLYYPFGTSTTQAITEIESSIPFKGSLRAMDILFANEKLNNVVINGLKADTMYLIENISKNKINKNLIILSLNKFDYLRSLISETDSDYKKDTYLKLEKHLQYISNYGSEKDLKDEEILELIKKNIGLFVFKDKFKKELDDKGYISNDRIV